MAAPSRGEVVPWIFPCRLYGRGRFCIGGTTSVPTSFRIPKDLSTCVATSFKDIMRIRIVPEGWQGVVRWVISAARLMSTVLLMRNRSIWFPSLPSG